MLSTYFSDQSITFAALSSVVTAVAAGVMLAIALGC